MVKKIIQGFMTASAETKKDLEAKSKKFVNLLLENLEVLLKTRTVFILIAFIENTNYSKQIKKALKNFDGFEEMGNGGDKGLKILYDLVTGTN